MKPDRSARRALLRAPLFAGLSEEALEEALEEHAAVLSSVKRGETLLPAGEPVTRFGLVLEGAVQALSYEYDGSRVILGHVGPGQTFGDALAVLHTGESPVTVVAAEPSRVLMLDLPRPGSPLSERMTAMLARRMLAMNEHIRILSQRTLREKLKAYLSRQARHADSRGRFPLGMSRTDLAEYVGANRSAVSRELSRMREEGLIGWEGKEFFFTERKL